MTAIGWAAGRRTQVLRRQALPSLRERLQQPTGPAARTAPRSTTSRPPRWRERLFAPGWPLAWAFVPFPLWWVVGWTEVMPVTMGLVMAVLLVRRRRVELPKGFGWWALYLVWSLAGVFVLGVPAYGAVADSGSTRILTVAYRLVWYLATTSVLLYVLNTRKELSSTRVMRIFALMFIWVMCGGILGIVAPTLEFSSLMELVLPSSVARTPFIAHMIHPTAAQLMDVLGYSSPRPSAPFTYTNTWGVNLAVLLPFFAAAWFGRGAGWRRVVAPLVVVATMVAVIFSLNRGLWVALAVAAVFVAVRAGLQGRPGVLLGLVAVGAVLVAVVALSPLQGMVEARLASEGSVQGRTNLSSLSVESVARTSPFVGLGSTRNVQGNFNSIAGGASQDCPRCSPPALGTQGQLWLVVFCQGFVGLVLYLGFFAASFLRNLRRRTTVAAMGLAALVLSTVTMPVYNSFGTGLMAVMAAVALMARDERALPAGGVPRLRHTLGAYAATLAHHRVLVLGLVLLGLLGGAGWQVYHGVPQQASSTFLAPTDRGSVKGLTTGLSTLDTQAQLLQAPEVQAAAAAATRPAGPHETRTLSLTATPNSRVLHIIYVADDAKDALAGSKAATEAFLRLDNSMVLAHRAAERRVMASSVDTLRSALDRAYADLATAKAREGKNGRRVDTVTLTNKIEQARVRLKSATDEMARMQATPVTLGSVLRQEPAKARTSVYNVSLTTGAWLGLLVGLLLATFLDRRGGRLGVRAEGAADEGLPFLGRVDLGARRRGARGGWRGRPGRPRGPRQDELELAGRQLAHYGVSAVVPATAAPVPPLEGPVAIVASTRTPLRDVLRTRDALVARGVPVRGVALA